MSYIDTLIRHWLRFRYFDIRYHENAIHCYLRFTDYAIRYAIRRLRHYRGYYTLALDGQCP